ncbi:MAG: DUF427 domain-containing protein [Actinomycetia bacterium]|nr:DUF427 domain-containing protein [Actinomycetes bacterium]MCH9800357.1 DUF427 domain-containing protein [Actinomycetes bacterium]
MKAIWRDRVIAESEDTVQLEGTHYFPPESLQEEFFVDSDATTVCPWKGQASYFDLVVDGETNREAAWVYRDPKPAAAEIKGHVAFWKDVDIQGEATAPVSQPESLLDKVIGRSQA